MMEDKPLQWGWNATVPVPGDYDGDRRNDLAVYHPATATWYIRKSTDKHDAHWRTGAVGLERHHPGAGRLR
jgi:hypothetical protein